MFVGRRMICTQHSSGWVRQREWEWQKEKEAVFIQWRFSYQFSLPS